MTVVKRKMDQVQIQGSAGLQLRLFVSLWIDKSRHLKQGIISNTVYTHHDLHLHSDRETVTVKTQVWKKASIVIKLNCKIHLVKYDIKT